jgi:ElaB/YqjD/DUF883 family membrane-anchored ribosome-binding protein
MADETKTETTDTIKDDIQKLRDDIRLLLGHIGTFGKGKLSDTRGKLSEAAGSFQDKAYDRLRGTTSGIGERSRYAVSRSRDTVQERPLTYLVIAFAAGMVFASLFGWRRS